jgi:hypothetical protein
MLRKLSTLIITVTLVLSLASTGATAQTQSKLSAAEIVNRNIAARGGLQAWRSVQAMTFEGRMGAGGNQHAPTSQLVIENKKVPKLPTDARPAEEILLPFVMQMARPRKLRFELQFKGQTAVQVFDGTNGWKLRPYLNRVQVEPYTADELKVASMQTELDGPLVDYAAKGTKVELDGQEKVEDKDNYKLKLTMKDGRVTHVWIDAGTFQQTKIEGQPRRLDGVEHPVEVYSSDYRTVDGLQIPFVLETRVLPAPMIAGRVKNIPIPSEKIVLEKVVVNPKFDAQLFHMPQVQIASNLH